MFCRAWTGSLSPELFSQHHQEFDLKGELLPCLAGSTLFLSHQKRLEFILILHGPAAAWSKVSSITSSAFRLCLCGRSPSWGLFMRNEGRGGCAELFVFCEARGLEMF